MRLDLIEAFLDGLEPAEQVAWAFGVLRRQRVADVVSGRMFFALCILAEEAEDG